LGKIDKSKGYKLTIEPKYACLGILVVAVYSDDDEQFHDIDLADGDFKINIMSGAMVEVVGESFPLPGKVEKDVIIKVNTETQEEIHEFKKGIIELSL